MVDGVGDINLITSPLILPPPWLRYAVFGIIRINKSPNLRRTSAEARIGCRVVLLAQDFNSIVFESAIPGTAGQDGCSNSSFSVWEQAPAVF